MVVALAVPVYFQYSKCGSCRTRREIVEKVNSESSHGKQILFLSPFSWAGGRRGLILW